MLFDLRGSGRRRVVKVVYITLAFLMGGGLVLFGIGGGGALSGGLVDAITRERRRRRRHRPLPRGRAEGDRRGARQPGRTRRSGPPSPARASTSPARATTSTRAPASSPTPGRRQLQAAGRAWEEHLEARGRQARLPRREPDGPGLLGARRARQGGASRRRSSRWTANRSAPTPSSRILAYQAGQLRKGDLATDKALELTEPDMREALKGQLEGAKRPGRASRPARAPRRRPRRPPEPRSSPRRRYNRAARALVAQLAEQRTLNPKVPGSIPGGGTS